MAGSGTNSGANVSALAQKAPNDGGSESTNLAAPQKVDSMEVHRKNWHGLNLFRPSYVCGPCHRVVYLWCMHCEECGFCLPTLECPVCGRAHPNMDNWLFQKWCREVDVEEVLATTLPKEQVSSDEELDLLSNPLLASPLGKELKKTDFQSCDSEVGLLHLWASYGPCATAKGEGKEGLAKCTRCRPSHFQNVYLENHLERNNPSGGGRLVGGQGYLVLVEPRALPHGNR